jgi:hypothetical protein
LRTGGKALSQIQDLKPTGGEAWAPDFVLLKALLFMETNAFKEEIDLFTQQGGRAWCACQLLNASPK